LQVFPLKTIIPAITTLLNESADQLSDRTLTFYKRLLSVQNLVPMVQASGRCFEWRRRPPVIGHRPPVIGLIVFFAGS